MYSSLNIYNQPVTLAPTTVASPNAAYQRMANFWGLVEDLKEGTYKIRSEHRKYLPQESRETDDSYDVRLSRSTVVVNIGTFNPLRQKFCLFRKTYALVHLKLCSFELFAQLSQLVFLRLRTLLGFNPCRPTGEIWQQKLGELVLL